MSFLAMPLGNALAGLSQMLVPGVRRLTRAVPDPTPVTAGAEPEPATAM